MDAKLYTEETLSTRIAGQSLIGVMGTPPFSHANYFWLVDGPRVINFWSENLQAADWVFGLEGKVNVRRYREDGRDFCIIADERIPKEWYHNKLCFTGGHLPSLEVIRDMYSYHGDPDNEFEQYSDPEAYWQKRGHAYVSKEGVAMVVMKVESTPRKVDSSWMLEPLADLVSATVDVAATQYD